MSEDPLGGCLYGVLAQTVAARSTGFREKLASMFVIWERSLQALLRDAQAAGEIDPHLDTKEAAAFLIEAYEGALIRMKVDGGPAAFSRFKRFALHVLAETTTASTK